MGGICLPPKDAWNKHCARTWNLDEERSEREQVDDCHAPQVEVAHAAGRRHRRRRRRLRQLQTLLCTPPLSPPNTNNTTPLVLDVGLATLNFAGSNLSGNNLGQPVHTHIYLCYQGV